MSSLNNLDYGKLLNNFNDYNSYKKYVINFNINFDDFQLLESKIGGIGEPIFSTKIKTFYGHYSYYFLIFGLYFLPYVVLKNLFPGFHLTPIGKISIIVTYIVLTQMFVNRKKYTFLQSLFPYNKMDKNIFLTEIFIGTSGIILYGEKSLYQKRYLYQRDKDIIFKKLNNKLDQKYINLLKKIMKKEGSHLNMAQSKEGANEYL